MGDAAVLERGWIGGGVVKPEVITTAGRIGERWAGIPGIERSRAGRIFVTFFSGGAREPAPENRIYLCTREAGEADFTAPRIVVDPPGDTRAYDPTLWLDPRGRLWLIYNQGNARTATHDVCAMICEAPDAGTAAWSAPRRIGFDVPFSFRMNKPTVLVNGEWLLPVTWSPERAAKWSLFDSLLQGVAISGDGGETWQLFGGVKAPPWALENMVIERRDGSLLMYIRTGAGVIWQSVSEDCGRSWGPASATSLANPGSRFFIRALASGRWLLLNTPDAKDRTSLVASLSEDEGRSWRGGYVLDERALVSYPDGVECPAGTLSVVHDHDRGGAAEILLSTLSENDILASG